MKKFLVLAIATNIFIIGSPIKNLSEKSDEIKAIDIKKIEEKNILDEKTLKQIQKKSDSITINVLKNEFKENLIENILNNDKEIQQIIKEMEKEGYKFSDYITLQTGVGNTNEDPVNIMLLFEKKYN